MDFETYAHDARHRLLRYAVVLTDDPELAQDVLQDVLLHAQQKWDRIGSMDNPHAYVRRMLTNQVVSWRRKWGRIEPRPDDDLDTAVADPTDGVARRDLILRQLARLPAKQRAVVVMRFFEDMPDAEIADTLGCRQTTVRGYMHRALATMRVDLAQSHAYL